MKKILILLLLYSQMTIAQDFQWLKQIGGFNQGVGNIEGRQTKTDAAGNVYVAMYLPAGANVGGTNFTFGHYIFKFDSNRVLLLAINVGEFITDFTVDGLGGINVTGGFNGTATFGSFTITATANTKAVYVVKYNANGVAQWVKNINMTTPPVGFTPENIIRGIVADASGNVFVTGGYHGTTDFGGTSLTSIFATDLFIAKYDNTGNLGWVQHAYTPNQGSPDLDNVYGTGITLDNAGNVIINAYLSGDIRLVPGGAILDVQGSFFLAKYGSGGGFGWYNLVSRPLSSPSNTSAKGNAVETDGLGNIYVTGSFAGIPNFSGTLLTSTSTSDGFIAKYTLSGAMAWVKQFAGIGTNICFGLGVEVDASGNAYAVGSFQGSTNFSGTSLAAIGTEDSFIAKFSDLGTLVSVKQFGSSGKNSRANGISMDGSGNTFITGYYQGTTNFSGTTLPVFGVQDAYLTKYNNSDVLQWAIHVGNATLKNATCKSIVADAAGNTLVTGEFGGVTNFGGVTLTPSSATASDIYVAKYNVSGTLQWAIQTTTGSYHFVNNITSDASGNAYITGVFSGTFNLGGTTLNGSGLEVFLAKYNNVGVLQWAKHINPTTVGGYSNGTGISVDGAGNVFLTGTFEGSTNFGGVSLISIGSADMFLAKYDAGGTIQWVKQSGSAGNINFGNGVAVDALGNAYVTGGFRGTTNFSGTTITASGLVDLFVAKFNSSGALTWVKQAGVAAQSVSGSDICIDASGNSYLSGRFGGTVNFGGSSLTSIGTTDMYISKFDNSGNLQWVRQAGSVGNSTSGRSNAVDGVGNVYVTGEFVGNTNFSGTTLNLIGTNDVYVAKYDNTGTFKTVKQIGGVSSTTNTSGISTDASANVYVSGTFEKTTNFVGNFLNTVGLKDGFVLSLGQGNTLVETITTTGNWNANGTWNTNTPPTATKTAKINASHTVNIPNSGNQVKTIQMNGGNINLTGGTLEIKNQ